MVPASSRLRRPPGAGVAAGVQVWPGGAVGPGSTCTELVLRDGCRDQGWADTGGHGGLGFPTGPWACRGTTGSAASGSTWAGGAVECGVGLGGGVGSVAL